MTTAMTLTMTLACILQGEASMMGLPAQIDVAQVALNRYNNGLDDYLGEGFYAWDAPTPDTIMAARLALILPDRTDGALYALSKSDTEKLGFGSGDIVHEGPAGLELHLYREWGGKR